SDIPVVIVSTECNLLKRSVLGRLGFAGYLRKPFAPTELKSLLDEHLEVAA
ncbi:MAG: DNA-binding response OmpR family regulator, partial [Planctomycetota bacterium]